MRTIVFFLEEPSAKEMLKAIIDRLNVAEKILPKFIVFEGKQDLEKRLELKLRGWKQSNSCFIVIRDQDSEDCLIVKQRLTNICMRAGKPETIVRIACKELESFYLGDLKAVENALGISGIARKQNKAKYRDPDAMSGPKEELKKLTMSRYQQIAGSRAIGKLIDINGVNRSYSFKILVNTIISVVQNDDCQTTKE